MLEKLFSFKDWDDVQPHIYQYADCTLQQDIGDRKAGEIIPLISIDFEHGQMELWISDKESELYLLSLNVEKFDGSPIESD